MKKNITKKIIISVIIFVIILLIVLVCINLFGSIANNRMDGIEEYTLTNKEKSSSEAIFKDLDELKSFKMYVNNKTIKIEILLKEEVKVDKIKSMSDKILDEISKDNLSFYDVEIFIDLKDNDKYPLNGHKHKSSEEFVW